MIDTPWFKARMKATGATTASIGALVGKSRTAVSHILNGRGQMTLAWAAAFAEALGEEVPTILDRAGAGPAKLTRQFAQGFRDSDAAPFTPDAAASVAEKIAVEGAFAALGGSKDVTLWRVRSAAMALAGILPDDFVLVDTRAPERASPGSLVLARQISGSRGKTMLLRRLEPPVLVAATATPDGARAHVIDGVTITVVGRIVAVWRSL